MAEPSHMPLFKKIFAYAPFLKSFFAGAGTEFFPPTQIMQDLQSLVWEAGGGSGLRHIIMKMECDTPSS